MHCAEPLRERITHAFAALQGQVDVVLLAGDLTTHGEPEQAAVLADACRPLELPVYAVLGNHDYHANRCDEVVQVLEGAGIHVLQRDHAVHEVGGLELGIVGVKGFVGGFPGAELPDFGEPLLREVYAETGARSRRSRPASRRSRAAIAASFCSITPRSRRRSSASPSRSGPSSARRGLRPRSADTGPTSSCTGTPTAAPSRPTSARCPSATWPST